MDGLSVEHHQTFKVELTLTLHKGFPGGSKVKASACNAGDLGLTGREDPLKKEMATHSSILAWRIPWMEGPGGLQSMGLQRVGCNQATNTHTY